MVPRFFKPLVATMILASAALSICAYITAPDDFDSGVGATVPFHNTFVFADDSVIHNQNARDDDDSPRILPPFSNGIFNCARTVNAPRANESCHEDAGAVAPSFLATLKSAKPHPADQAEISYLPVYRPNLRSPPFLL